MKLLVSRDLFLWIARRTRRTPFTALLIASILVASSAMGLFTHVMEPDQLQRWGFGWEDLTSGRLGRLLTAPFFVLKPYMALTIAAILLFFVGTCELLWRTRRTAVAFVTSHVAGYVGSLLILRVLGRVGWNSAAQLAVHRDVGASNGAFGAAGALLMALPATLRTTGMLILLAYLFAALVIEQQLWDVQHLVAFGTGTLLGALYRRRDRARLEELEPTPDVLHRQRPRVMSWLVGGMGAVNILAALLLPRHAGFERLEALLPLGVSNGPRMLLMFSGLVLLIAASALRRAQRVAWWIAFMMLLATILLHFQLGVSGMEVLFALVFLLLLVGWKEDFPAPSDPPSLSNSRNVAIVSAVMVPIISWLAMISIRGEYTGIEGFPSTVVDVLRRLFYLAPASLVPLTRRADWLLEAIPLVFWAGTVLALSIAVRAIRAPRAPLRERTRAQQLVKEYGSTSTAFMTTWSGNSYFFVPGETALVAYRVHAGVAVVLGDPVGPAPLRRVAISEFLGHCRARGWTPTFLAATQVEREAYESLGFRLLQIGEEAVIPLRGLEFKGKEWQNMRSALNRARREGLTFHLHEGGRVPPELVAQMREITREWLGEQQLPPMEFTLGSVDDVHDPEIEVAVAVDPTGRLHGFVDWLPIPARRGWVIDLMRRRRDCMSGTMEYLVGMSLLAFQQRGEEFASLATAPLADLGRDAQTDLVPRIMGTMFTRFDAFYDFKSLFDFKDRFQPKWEPTFLAYLDPVELPAIAFAILRAHLPHLSLADLSRLLGSELAGRLRPQGGGDAPVEQRQNPTPLPE